jgi:hypothetical protein
VSAGRLFLLLALAAGAMSVSALAGTHALHTLTGPITAPSTRPTSTPRKPARNSTHARRLSATPARRGANRPGRRIVAEHHGPRVLGISLARLVAAEALLAVCSIAGLAIALTAHRIRRRARRVYARYDLHLSPHDEAKPQDLEDLFEAIANTIRALPTERARDGQPFVALELHHEPGPSGAMELALAIRCEARSALALDAALSATYPDVRLGRRHSEPPTPRPETPRAPAVLLRFAKRRGFVYPLVATGDELASPPLEGIAHAQAATAAWSVVRFALTPAPAAFEELARAAYRRHENRLVRQERWGLPEGGLTSTLNRVEMADAQRTQNRSLFWLEATVASDDAATARRLAAALQARRGENRLRRRWILVRADLYRRRFATATPPLIPSPRTLVSAAEAAHLLALPSARMKGVPVRRLAIPRIPMPPEILRADPDAPVATPPASRDATTDRAPAPA